ncbi:MAG: caspase family protein, partial [Rhodospirillales bacterium]|nr:caspase family protein [Rhodospirillales bacterium]
KIALVIGNAAYKEAPLKNPVNDARAMAAKLRQLGFQVIAQENATKAQMEKSVLDFGEALSAGAVGMFYYAGHGLQVNGRNFLVPVDATMRSEQRVRLETLDVDILLDQMDVAKSGVNLVILDACRNNPFERRLRSTGSGLAQINAPQGTLIAYATAPGKVAADGEGANGVYTARLLQHMSAPGLAIEEVFKRVRSDVARDTAGAQTPWESSSLTGGFFFVEPAPVAPPPVVAAPRPEPPPPAPAPAIDREALFWQSIGDSNDPAMLQAYLGQYPNGAFAPLARAKIASLERRQKEEQDQKTRAQQLAAAPAPPPPPPTPSITPEQALWDAIKDANNPAMFQGYLDRYPNGLYAQAAAVKLAALRPPPAAQLATPAPAAPARPTAPPPPVQQAAAPVPPPATAATAGSRDGRWSGSSGGWEANVVVAGDTITGTVRNRNRGGGSNSAHGAGEMPLSAKIDAQGMVTGHVAVSGGARFDQPIRVAGRFPTLQLSPAAGSGETIALQREGGEAGASAPDDRWQGRGASWQLDLRLAGDQLTGTGRHRERSGEFSFSGRVDPTSKVISGTANHPRLGFPARIAGRFPTIEIITANSGSDTVVLEPVAGSAARSAAPIAANAPTAASRDGKWTGKDGEWSVEVEVAGSRLSGTARGAWRGGGWTLSATVAEDGTLSGIITAPRGSTAFDGKIMGRFPTMEFSSGSAIGARIALQPAP